MTSRALKLYVLSVVMPVASLADWSEPMFFRVIRLSLPLMLILSLPFHAAAQSGQDAAPPPEVVSGGYVIHQSIEMGVRVSDNTGSAAMYDTMVNLHTGPRVLDQMLSMRSENHQGILFDNLLVHSIGWGGDPNNYLRFSANKNKWYDFRASFRRDQDFFNYNLVANPLNPATSVPNVPVGSSPHSFETRRRMSDGMGAVTFKPVNRVAALVDYSITSVDGTTPQFNNLQPEGSLQYNYHLPLANFSIDLGHSLAWNAAWNYYQYKEQSFVGPTDARYFHANNATLSLRWAF